MTFSERSHEKERQTRCDVSVEKKKAKASRERVRRENFLTPVEAARLLNVGSVSVRRLIRNGKLPAYTIPGGKHARIERQQFVRFCLDHNYTATLIKMGWKMDRSNVKPGDKVKVNVPDNPRIHGATATVTEVKEWGCHTACPVAATGEYRLTWEEMLPLPASTPDKKAKAREMGYTGDFCPNCQGVKMRRNGACLMCDDCGTTTGCS